MWVSLNNSFNFSVYLKIFTIRCWGNRQIRSYKAGTEPQCSVSTLAPKSRNYKALCRDTRRAPLPGLTRFSHSLPETPAPQPHPNSMPLGLSKSQSPNETSRKPSRYVWRGQRADPVLLFKSFATAGKIEAWACISFARYEF